MFIADLKYTKMAPSVTFYSILLTCFEYAVSASVSVVNVLKKHWSVVSDYPMLDLQIRLGPTDFVTSLLLEQIVHPEQKKKQPS